MYKYFYSVIKKVRYYSDPGVTTSNLKNTTVFLGYIQSNVAKKLFPILFGARYEIIFLLAFRFTTLGEDNVHDDSFPKNLCLKVNNKVN
jgi:hypothetical protein